MKTLCVILTLTLSVLLTDPAAQAKSPRFHTRTIRVDCDHGETIARALKFRAYRLVVEVRGVCQGDVLIERDRVTLLGVSSDATLAGDPEVPGPALEISGASKINVVDLTIQGGDSAGVLVQRNGEVRLERVKILDTATIGLFLNFGSSALLVDSMVLNHQFFGAVVFGSSGLTVQGANEFSGNGQAGLLISDGASLNTQGIGTVTANDNGAVGIILQSGAASLFPSAIALRNGFAGLQVAFSATFSSIGNVNDFSDNGAYGALLFNDSHLSAAGNFRNNAVAGIMATEGSVVSVASNVPSDISGSPVGVVLEGAIGVFDTVTVDSMELSFGSRAMFNPQAVVTNLSCDSTVLTRGGISCPSPATNSSHLLDNKGASLADAEWPGWRRVFQLPVP